MNASRIKADSPPERELSEVGLAKVRPATMPSGNAMMSLNAPRLSGQITLERAAAGRIGYLELYSEAASGARAVENSTNYSGAKTVSVGMKFPGGGGQDENRYRVNCDALEFTGLVGAGAARKVYIEREPFGSEEETRLHMKAAHRMLENGGELSMYVERPKSDEPGQLRGAKEKARKALESSGYTDVEFPPREQHIRDLLFRRPELIGECMRVTAVKC